MPYASNKQAAYIHIQAKKGVAWAKKFVQDAHGTHVQPPKKKSRKKKRHRRHLPPKGY